MKVVIDDVEFTNDRIIDLKLKIIQMRNLFMDEGKFDYSISLTYVIAILSQIENETTQ